ncbi:hypothetical protein [Sediminibacterium soli]|uniref:hypothetical protein n=1 Tax=Sediminibacterium soli TaxID=2698829 RepID=UPI00137B72C4|nr:hypothetical protein [Sediminibacterium soli]NCI46118.1 hypothetical protein [Sediminibacterium soli]
MKKLLLSAILGMAIFSGCSTAYKAGQTPDDVYYSPGREGLTAKEETRRQQDREDYDEYISSQDDRYLRMKVANRNRWSSLDDYAYWYDSRYDFCNYNNYSLYNTWNNGLYIGVSYYGRPYWGGGAYYGWNNPYYTLVNYSTPKFGGGGYTSGSNLSAYKNKTYNNSNYGYRDKSGNFVPSATNNNNFGNLLKKVFTTSPNGSTNSFDRPARTFAPTNNSSTPSTSSSAGGNSGGFKSSGSSSSTGRGGRG